MRTVIVETIDQLTQAVLLLSTWRGTQSSPMRVLRDENLPQDLVTKLGSHEVDTVNGVGEDD